MISQIEVGPPNRSMTEPGRLGVVPTVGLVALLIVGFALATVDPFTLLFYTSYVSIGALLAIRRPRNSIGWLLIVIGFGFLGTTTSPNVDPAALIAGTAGTWENLVVWVNGWSGYASFIGFFALMLVFPSGHITDGRWRATSLILLSFGVILIVLTAIAPTVAFNSSGGAEMTVVPNPFAVLPGLPLWAALPSGDLLILPIVALLVVGVGSILARYRRSTGILRLQLRWLVAAVTFVVAALLLGLALIGLLGETIGGLAWVPAILAYPTVPIAMGVAVLRYHLLEIDRLVSRTVAYALLTGLLVVVYVAIILVVQGVLTSVTQAQAQTIAVAASTLAVFALFQPLRRRVQRTIDRRFDRARFDADRTAAAFSERLRHEVDIEAVGADLQGTVRAAIVPQSIGLWIRPTESAGSRTS